MAAHTQLAARPVETANPATPSRYRRVGIGIASLGFVGAVVAAIGDFASASSISATNSLGQNDAWTFGVGVFSFGVVKIAIAAILMGIIVRLWFRVDAIKAALPALKRHNNTAPSAVRGDIKTDWGKATVTDHAPKPLPIHRMAKFMWRPMLAMGTMALSGGLISSLVWANRTPGTESFRQAAAFTQGLEFLGETFLLAGIAMLLGTVLAGLRAGGGEVQQSLGLPVTTLKMPATAKAFVGLMAAGVMAGITQFVLYIGQISNADNVASFTSWANWLAPFRELALGLILAGIVMALATIGNALNFQFNRITTIIRTGA